MPYTDPEKRREYVRRSYVKNRAKILARQQQHRRENHEKQREIERRSRAKVGKDGRRVQVWAWNHGMRPEDWAAMWDAQGGKCYLCGEEMAADQAHIDHDHRCCPRLKSCRWCRRGLACSRCNQLIGMAGDNPDRLRRIADNLEPVLAATSARLAAKPEQMALDIA